MVTETPIHSISIDKTWIQNSIVNGGGYQCFVDEKYDITDMAYNMAREHSYVS